MSETSGTIQPCDRRVEVVARPWGYTVYGVESQLVTDDGWRVPLRLFVSMHSWRWRAYRAARRWMERMERADG